MYKNLKNAKYSQVEKKNSVKDLIILKPSGWVVECLMLWPHGGTTPTRKEVTSYLLSALREIQSWIMLAFENNLKKKR